MQKLNEPNKEKMTKTAFKDKAELTSLRQKPTAWSRAAGCEQYDMGRMRRPWLSLKIPLFWMAAYTSQWAVGSKTAYHCLSEIWKKLPFGMRNNQEGQVCYSWQMAEPAWHLLKHPDQLTVRRQHNRCSQVLQHTEAIFQPNWRYEVAVG